MSYYEMFAKEGVNFILKYSYYGWLIVPINFLKFFICHS